MPHNNSKSKSNSVCSRFSIGSNSSDEKKHYHKERNVRNKHRRHRRHEKRDNSDSSSSSDSDMEKKVETVIVTETIEKVEKKHKDKKCKEKSKSKSSSSESETEHKKEIKKCKKVKKCKEKSKSKSKSNSFVKKGSRGSRGHKGSRGPKGSDGPRGKRGPCGKTGKRGKRGKKGSRGPCGPPPCRTRCLDFKQDRCDLGLYHCYNIDYYPFMAYGYEKKDDFNPDCPTCLVSTCEKGLGIKKVECKEINKHTYIQFDLCHLIRDCSVKGLCCTVGFIKKGFCVYGSNCLGEIGHHLYTYDKEENDENECKQTFDVPCYGKYKYISITAVDDCDALVSILCFFIKREFEHAFGYFYTVASDLSGGSIDISGGAPVPFEMGSLIEGFVQVDPFTIRCEVRGVYSELMNISTVQPNSFSINVNGSPVSGLWYGSNGNDQVVGNGMFVLNVGDLLQVINQTAGMVSLIALGGVSPNFQTVASLQLQRVV